MKKLNDDDCWIYGMGYETVRRRINVTFYARGMSRNKFIKTILNHPKWGKNETYNWILERVGAAGNEAIVALTKTEEGTIFVRVGRFSDEEKTVEKIRV